MSCILELETDVYLWEINIFIYKIQELRQGRLHLEASKSSAYMYSTKIQQQKGQEKNLWTQTRN